MTLKRVICFACLMVCVCLLTACGLRDTTDYFAYGKRDFSATLRGSFCRTAPDGYEAAETDFAPSISRTGEPWSFAATVTVKQPDGTGNDGAVTVTFSEPVALKGLTARRENGTTTVTLGDMTVTDTEKQGIYDDLLRVADVLLSHGEITSVTSAGEGMTQVNVKTDTATGQFSFSDSDPAASLPKRIKWTDAGWWLDVRLDEVQPQ